MNSPIVPIVARTQPTRVRPLDDNDCLTGRDGLLDCVWDRRIPAPGRWIDGAVRGIVGNSEASLYHFASIRYVVSLNDMANLYRIF